MNQSVIKGFKEKFEDVCRLITRYTVGQREVNPIMCGVICRVSKKFRKPLRLCGRSSFKEKPLRLQTDIGDAVGAQYNGDFGLDYEVLGLWR